MLCGITEGIDHHPRTMDVLGSDISPPVQQQGTSELVVGLARNGQRPGPVHVLTVNTRSGVYQQLQHVCRP